jgi:hypothetical protein
VDDGVLRGARREAIKGLVLGAGKRGTGRRLGWRYVRSGFRLLDAWVKANGGACCGGDLAGFREIAGELDLLSMPLKALRETVGAWRNVDPGWVDGLYERKEASGADAYLVEYHVERRYDLGQTSISVIAVDGRGAKQRMAFIDETKRVRIMFVESGKHIANAATKHLPQGEGHGPFEELVSPSGLAFSGNGELYVSDSELNRICVFDYWGQYVRGFGSKGDGEGQFDFPQEICFTTDGNLVVADSGNLRVQIVREDGTFVRAFSAKINGSADRYGYDCLDDITHVSAGPDGLIAVAGCGREVWTQEPHYVYLFDAGEGRFVRRFSLSLPKLFDGHGGVRGLAFGKGGEIIASSFCQDMICIFSKEGELMQNIGPRRQQSYQPGKPGLPNLNVADSQVDLHFGYVGNVATDADGRIFVGITRPNDDWNSDDEDNEENGSHFERQEFIVLLS